MSPVLKTWFTPSTIITVLTLLFSAGSTMGVIVYRTASIEKSVADMKRESEQKITRIEGRLDQMSKDSTETIRLQERLRSLEAVIQQMERRNEVSEARWDNLNTRLSRNDM